MGIAGADLAANHVEGARRLRDVGFADVVPLRPVDRTRQTARAVRQQLLRLAGVGLEPIRGLFDPVLVNVVLDQIDVGFTFQRERTW